MEAFIVQPALAIWQLALTMQAEEGRDMIEYALLAALIAVACIVVMASLRTSIRGRFTSIASILGSA